MYHVYVRDGTGDEFILRLPATATLGNLKHAIFEATGIYLDYFRLLFNGENLSRSLGNSDLLTTAGIGDGSVINLVILRDMDERTELDNYYKAVEMKSVKALKAILERGNLSDRKAHLMHGNLPPYDAGGGLEEYMIGVFPNVNFEDDFNVTHDQYHRRTPLSTQREEQYCMAGMDPSFACKKTRKSILDPPFFTGASHVTPDVFVEAGATARPNWEAAYGYNSPRNRDRNWMDFLHSLGV